MASQGKAYIDLLKYSSLGLEMGAAVVIGLLLGTWLDRRYHTTPWLTLLGLGFGFAAAARSITRAVRRELERQRAEEKEEGGPPP